MPFCPQCGAGIESDASFCPNCGNPVGARQAAAQSAPVTMPSAASAPGQPSAPAQPAGPGAAQPGQPTQSAQPAPQPSAKQRKLSAPAIAGIVVAAALVAGVGGGLVYTQVIAPAIQQQQQADAEAAQAQKAAEAAARMDEAKNSYQAVLDDYNSAISEYSTRGSKYDQAAFTAKHTYVYNDRALDATYLNTSTGRITYSYATFGDSDTPALLVKSTVSDSASVDAIVEKLIAVYTLVDGKPVLVAQSLHENQTLSLVDGKYLSLSGQTQNEKGETVSYTLYFDPSDGASSGEGSQAGDSGSNSSNASSSSSASDQQQSSSSNSATYVNGLQVNSGSAQYMHGIASESKPQGGGVTTYVHADGSTTTSDSDSSTTADSLRQECSSKYTEKVETNWLSPSQKTVKGKHNGQDIEYAVQPQSISVNVLSDNPHVSKTYSIRDEAWQYDALWSSCQSDVVDKINESVRRAMQQTTAATSQVAADLPSKPENVCISRSIKISYLTDNVVCFTDACYVTNYGTHGWNERGGIAFSLETGEQVSMASVMGIDQSSLLDLTCSAVKTYLTNNKSDSLTPSKAAETTQKRYEKASGKFTTRTTAGLDGEELYCITDKGMYYLTEDYELGSHAFGIRSICVAAFNDQSLVGKDSSGK